MIIHDNGKRGKSTGNSYSNIICWLPSPFDVPKVWLGVMRQKNNTEDGRCSRKKSHYAWSRALCPPLPSRHIFHLSPRLSPRRDAERIRKPRQYRNDITRQQKGSFTGAGKVLLGGQDGEPRVPGERLSSPVRGAAAARCSSGPLSGNHN